MMKKNDTLKQAVFPFGVQLRFADEGKVLPFDRDNKTWHR